MGEQVIRQIGEAQDRASIIERLNPTKIIPRISEQLLGIRKEANQNASQVTVRTIRYNKPLFTEEFVRLIDHELYGYVNNVTTFTKYTTENIRLRIVNIGIDLNTLLATKGNDGYISEDTWDFVLRIHESGERDEKNKLISSGWQKFGINWTYDSPVTQDMIKPIKDFDENADQEVVFSNVANQCRHLIESCYRRSSEMPDKYYGMTSNLISETTMERSNYNTSEEAQSADSSGKW